MKKEILESIEKMQYKINFQTQDRLKKIQNEIMAVCWANNECAQMLYNCGNNWYQLVRLDETGKLWKVSQHKRNTKNCPILIKGIIAYVIRNLGKSEQEIFKSYYELCRLEYMKIEESEPGASSRNLDSDFHNLHLIEENLKIKFSLRLAPYLSEDEFYVLKKYAKYYLIYIEKEYSTISEKLVVKIQAKYYALFHRILIEMGRERDFESNDNGDYYKSKIIAFAMERYPKTSSQGFYKAFHEFRNVPTAVIANTVGKRYKDFITEISNNDAEVMTHIKSYSN